MSFFSQKSGKSERAIDPRERHTQDVKAAQESYQSSLDNLYVTFKDWLTQYYDKHGAWPETKQGVILEFAATKAKDPRVRDTINKFPWPEIERMIIKAEETIIKEKASEEITRTGTEG